MSLALLVLVFSIASNKFLTPKNIINILQQTTINGAIAIGMTLVIVTGGIDLSVGSVMALSAMLMAKSMAAGVSAPIAVIIGLLTGTCCGAVNGAIISRMKLQPFLVTLGTMSVLRGLTLIISNGLPVRGLPSSFSTYELNEFLCAGADLHIHYSCGCDFSDY